MSDKTLKQKINDFLCKYAQGDYKDEYGKTVRKTDGTFYKSGKVTCLDIVINLIIIPLIIVGLVCGVFSLLGLMVGMPIFTQMGVNINIHWLINPLIYGIILTGMVILIVFVIYFIIKIIYKALTVEVAKCPLVEVPSERRKCDVCSAPLSYVGEEIEVKVKDPKYDRISLGYCKVCKAPKLYDSEKYTINVISYDKPKV